MPKARKVKRTTGAKLRRNKATKANQQADRRGMCVGRCGRQLVRCKALGLLTKLLPCAHECVCSQCVHHLVKDTALRCPMCRAAVQEVWRVAGGGVDEAELFKVNGSSTQYARQLQYEHHVAAERERRRQLRLQQKQREAAERAEWEAAVVRSEAELKAYLVASDAHVRACLASIVPDVGTYVADWKVDACLVRAPPHMAPLVEAWNHSEPSTKMYLRRVVREHMGWCRF